MWWSTIPSLQRLIEHIRHKNTKKPWKRQEKWKEIIHSLFTKKPFCRWNRFFGFYTVSKVLLQSGKMMPFIPKTPSLSPFAGERDGSFRRYGVRCFTSSRTSCHSLHRCPCPVVRPECDDPGDRRVYLLQFC